MRLFGDISKHSVSVDYLLSRMHKNMFSPLQMSTDGVQDARSDSDEYFENNVSDITEEDTKKNLQVEKLVN